MGKIENDELRKLKNANFMKAFKYVASKLKMNQGQLAEAIGSKSAYISNFSSGIRPVPEETIDALVSISAKIPNGQIFREYLYGNSEIMLLKNVTYEEMNDAKRRSMNPDYDVMQARMKQKEKQLDAKIAQNLPYIDPGSQINAIIAAKDETIDSLKSRIADLQRTIADKEEIIQAREARIAELERQLAAATTGDLSRYPFNFGAAEDNKPHI